MQIDALSTAPCSAETLVRLSELTFRDFVCQPESRRVLQELMRGGLVAFRQLHSRCPSLFSASDLQVQEALELLGTVRSSLSASPTISTLDGARFGQLTRQALQSLEYHAAKVDLNDAASRLRSIGAFKGLVSLALAIARCRDPRDEAVRPQDLADPRFQQVHYARLECYQVVLEMLEALIVLARQRTSRPTLPSSQPSQTPDHEELPELVSRSTDPMILLDMLLRHCLESQQYRADELFHYCILKWMMQHGFPPYRYNSPFVQTFLETRARDQPELLCQFFQQRGRWSQACDAYISLAKSAKDRQEQVLHLQSAVMCAQMPGSNRKVDPIVLMMKELQNLS